MSKFKITKLEHKTSPKTGKKYAVADLKGEDGKEALFVSLWHKLDEIKEGDTIEGKLRESGQYTNFDFPDKPKPKRGTNFEGAMERKEKSISKFQDSKDQGIMVAAVFRDATLLVTAMVQAGMFKDPEKMGVAIREAHILWREWLLDQWQGEKGKLNIPY